MDFPTNLTDNPNWVYSREELKQVVVALLKNPIGSFIQSNKIGAKFSVHGTDDSSLEEGIRLTLEQIPLIAVNDITINNGNVVISITYNGEVIKYQYSLEV